MNVAYDHTRALMLRALGVIYVFAFLVAWNQAVPLIGERGLMPFPLFLERAPDALSVLKYWPTDAGLLTLCWCGLALSAAVVAGLRSWVVMAALWVLYQSLVNVGQTFWGFGWEIMLLEAGFLGIFLAIGEAMPQVFWLYRWMLFRVIFGAGLIKLRGDACWRDLTCLAFHYETQPVPNPFSATLHFMPLWFHQVGVAFNHFVELVVPFGLFGPRRVRWVAGGLQAVFQGILILSGNLSFLNWLTLVLCVAAFDDGDGDGSQEARRRKPGNLQRVVVWGLVCGVGILSVGPVGNMLSRRQVMNTSFDRFHLVNTYGAFGHVGRERFEVVVEGTADEEPESARWREYEFPVKPGDVNRRPPWISPYHYRFDWQIWFAAMSVYPEQPWLVHFAVKLVEGDREALKLVRVNPFPGAPPRWVRMTLYRYRFARSGSSYWVRERVRPYLPPIERGNPSVGRFLEQTGMVR